MPNSLQYRDLCRTAATKLYRDITPERQSPIRTIEPVKEGSEHAEIYTKFEGVLRDCRKFQASVDATATEVTVTDMCSGSSRTYSFDNRGHLTR